MSSFDKIRTRIAPSPTGFLHLGTARTALFSWAYARHHGGQFVLRIEDTDVARSTQDSVEQIIQAMNWLGLSYDEGPIYQMQRLDRYQAVIDQLIAEGKAYRCYATPEELNEMREAQKARGEKTLYDRRWRPEPGKVLPTPPEGVKPVIRFANPIEGDVTWNDLVKGPITINNREIDDLIIARTDGVPTYNFAVVVDDWDMRISHVFRGDEHVNNTPWQINIFNALGAPLPQFGHLPIILGDDGLKLSKRRGAVSVMDYAANGYLPEAMLNYLARLGWSHGDDELFSAAQMVAWFDGSHLSRSPAQWDPAKLDWVNGHYVKTVDEGRLAALVVEQLAGKGLAVSAAQVQPKVGLFKDRCATVAALADWLSMYFAPVSPSAEDLATHVTEAVRPAIAHLAGKLSAVGDWNKGNIQQALKDTLAATGLKMPQLAVPVRVLVCGRAQTPSLDAVLEHFDQKKVLERLQAV
ncbi:glutamate--tRNA ligase [Roseateles puraquae]|uniref:Glutamate--tRNA ligase n=1 Tax=Roseateles puraquae TaxID=431059 RepID=A0A254NKE7_9BURK|nr:glutamate--tRNA ligase [Roseateles puraquae]MDG0852520.1 glutamate--tRNA ligase [Roseateles puraquae]OWR05243.1 glutamate--tRNA ligase [Roseateles puraquae]